ncbi:hypothetical protein NLX71_08120 [Paenibacillus sp. MZ04-78.2]|uniref:hypothetical protein n=1 Tax=Paenibacillus sp. MZ04-78.2 TaxID=2962034 RepID=UPI0020B75CD3|nr:hypothetical protein [Paenibacillus sp. MZ04-78.2]MCP3773282.1 hypothetical protein [Paenibacillus sp. MZ04-78.2]
MAVKRLGCLHAHHSNIRYLEEGLAREAFSCLHFVDPGAIHWLTRAAASEAEARQVQTKLRGQLEWISGCGVDAIVITCTNYIAALSPLEQALEATGGIPVIAIDEPWFDELLKLGDEAVVAFTNLATVEGTMERLHAHARLQGRVFKGQIAVSDPACFEMLLQGQEAAYTEQVEAFLLDLIHHSSAPVAAAQLSMTDAAERAEAASGARVLSPMQALRSRLEELR